MRFIKQVESLPIRNMDLTNASVKKKHGPLLPNSIRGLMVGPSNCGKTNVMLSLLEHPNGLKFENIYLFCKTLEQPKYEYLKQVMKPISGLGYYAYTDNNEIIPPEEANRNSVFIFDDVACDKQNNIRSYFCMGRHRNIDSFYLCQTYTHIPKHLVRDNTNFIIIFKQDELNLKHIYSDHVNTDMTFDKFRELCSKCWKDEYGFLTIDKDSAIDKGRYRKGLDTFIAI